MKIALIKPLVILDRMVYLDKAGKIINPMIKIKIILTITMMIKSTIYSLRVEIMILKLI